MKCETCYYFKEVKPITIPTMKWDGDIQHIEVIEPEHDGICEHEYNWRPSRGEMTVDKDFRCNKYENKEVEAE